MRALLLFQESSVQKGDVSPRELIDLLNTAAGQEAYEAWLFEDLRFEVGPRSTSIKNADTGADIKDFDFVYFRRWGEVKPLALSCSIYLEKNGVPFIESEPNRLGSQRKLSPYFRFWELGLPIPQTLFWDPHYSNESYEDIDRIFPRAFVMKSNTGTRGQDNYLIETKQQFSQVDTDGKAFVIQEYIPNSCDYRLFVTGDEVPLIIKRTRTAGQGHTNNVSNGAKAELVHPDDFDPAIIQQSVVAAQAFHREIAGVDVILRDDGSPVFLEVNRSPQVDGASFGLEKAQALHAYFSRLTNGGDVA